MMGTVIMFLHNLLWGPLVFTLLQNVCLSFCRKLAHEQSRLFFVFACASFGAHGLSRSADIFGCCLLRLFVPLSVKVVAKQL